MRRNQAVEIKHVDVKKSSGPRKYQALPALSTLVDCEPSSKNESPGTAELTIKSLSETLWIFAVVVYSEADEAELERRICKKLHIFEACRVEYVMCSDEKIFNTEAAHDSGNALQLLSPN
ncbi:unnamed protein product [Cylicostephanus goldi]|uniref:Uncharacterized protein n=1 Tax=Cylicostephanus goldi TaxID=71465 RepID=A0A3P7R385_CYLGO|nr:unnamed protein product [Cylicostephanus goldi]